MEKQKILESALKTLQGSNFYDCTAYLQREAFLVAKEIIGGYPGIRVLKQKSHHLIESKDDRNAVHVERILRDCLIGAAPHNAYDIIMDLLTEALNDLKITTEKNEGEFNIHAKNCVAKMQKRG